MNVFSLNQCLPGQAKLFSGAAYTGKTQKLLGELENLLQEGVAPAEMLVLCATPAAAQNLSARLQAQRPGAQAIEVTTPQAFFFGLLNSDAARVATGRKARLLLPFEYDFFLEDLKTSGIRPKRLREILRFFYRGLSELADDEPDWLITKEERELFSLIQANLAFSAAILEPELANLALKYLKSSPQVLEKAKRTAVLVDDFPLLSRASQVASCLLARKYLVLTAGQEVPHATYESYPYPDGIDEFIAAFPAVVHTRLTGSYSCCSAAKASRALLREQDAVPSAVPSAAPSPATPLVPSATPSAATPQESVNLLSLQCLEAETPHDELTQVADEVARLTQNGVLARDILIVAPHAAWARNILRQLAARSVPAQMLPDARFLRGDIRDTEKSFSARFLTLLNLLADPTDAVAWRCWCGFGDYLTNSNGLRSLRNLEQFCAKTFDAVVETAVLPSAELDGPDALASIQRITHARDVARALMARLGALAGQDLLDAIAQELGGPDAQVPEGIQILVAAAQDGGEGMSAVALARHLRHQLEFPTYGAIDVVRVAAYGDVVGMNPRHLFLTGFVNGFFPRYDYFDATLLSVEKREKRHREDTDTLASIVAKTSDTLHVSSFKTLDPTSAERLGVVINRIVLEKGIRVAKTEPSIFLGLISA
ncbi:MAG: hypothetical protein LBU48_03065 [Coriobacteriales bacterium]|nr:hypothetical protein [Coriobacteriales bacterium]